MKRIISIVLAIALVAAMLPTFAFAAEGEDGILIKYDVHGAITKLGATWEAGTSTSKKPFTMLNWDFTNGFFNFATSSGTDGIYTNHASINYSPKVGIQLAKGNSFAIEIYVPKAGTYDMKMLYGNSAAAAQTSVFVNKDAVSYDEKDKVGSYECFIEGTIDKEANRTDPSQIIQLNHTFEAIVEDIEFEEAGTYFVSFYTNGSYGSVGTFYLIENGTGTANSIVSVETSIDNSSLTLDAAGGAQVSIDAIYLGDGNVASDIAAYTIEYASSNNAVATVDATGKVTPISEGRAEITVTATDSLGATAKSTQEVTVGEYGFIFEYNIARMRGKKFVAEWSAENYNAADEAGKANIIKSGEYANITYEASSGFFKFAGTNADTPDAGYKVSGTETLHLKDTYYPGCGIRLYDNSIQIQAGKYMAYELNVPIAGEYDVQVIHWTSTNDAYNRDAELYISQGGISTDKDDLVGTFNVYNKTENVERIATYNFEKPGKYVFTVRNPGSGSTYTLFAGIILKNGNSNAVIGELSADKNVINASEGETAKVTARGYLSSTAYDTFSNIGKTDPTAATGFVYSSSDEKIATVDAQSGVVTPVSEGVVTISAKTPDAKNKLTTEITVTVNKPGEEVEDTTVNFTAFAENGGTVTNDKEVREVPIGSKITVEATANEGYEFAYWRNASGKHLSSDAKETFTVNTNTAVIAVFDKTTTTEADATAPVYFYNENGSLIEKKDVEKGKTFGEAKEDVETSLTGHVFSKWSIEDNTVISKLLRAVALYNKEETEYKVTVGGAVKASGKYGDEVTVKGGDNFKAWKLGNNIVSYDKEYKFFIWGDIELIEVTEGEAKAEPTIAINKSGENYFIAYNVPTGYTLVEAGIVFANSGTPTIGSFYSKATAKETTGQFTSKSGDGTETTARGYLIFRDASGSVRVIYAD